MRISDWSSDVCSSDLGLAALLIAGLALSGCMTDGYGRSYGSVSVGSGWYDDYGYPGYYPGYYGYDYGYRDSPGYYHVPRHRHSSRWKDRKPDGKWEGRDRKSTRLNSSN